MARFKISNSECFPIENDEQQKKYFPHTKGFENGCTYENWPGKRSGAGFPYYVSWVSSVTRGTFLCGGFSPEEDGLSVVSFNEAYED